MRKSLVNALLVLVAVASLVACDREIKPTKPGVFIVSNGKLTDWQATPIDEEITNEGFILPFFTGEVTTIVHYPTTYMIFNGDYKPLGLRLFVRRNGRWEDEGSKGLITDVLQTQQFKGEKQMYKVRLTHELKPGIYVIDVQQTEGRLIRFAFKVP
jgi:hypothetical protein